MAFYFEEEISVRTILFETARPTNETTWYEYRYFCDGELAAKARYGEYIFLQVDDNAHTLRCEEYLCGASRPCSVCTNTSDLVTLPAGTGDLRIMLREELGRLCFAVQTFLS